MAGVCHTETFDVTPYAKACAYYLLGHPDTQDFGRKFKIAFSGCKHEACALVSMHDLGGIAATRNVDGKTQRGFEIYVGGGLGAVPQQAKLFEEFLPEEELLPLARAIGRVFARLGEKKNRNKARLKFVVQKLGIDEFRRVVDGRTRTHARRSELAKVFRRDSQIRRTARPEGRPIDRRQTPGRLRRLGGDQCLRAATSRLFAGDRHPAAGRCVERAVAQAGGHRRAAMPAIMSARPSSRTSCSAGSRPASSPICTTS